MSDRNGALISLTRLWAKTSQRTGKVYLTGRLGAARLLISENDAAGDGEPTHLAYLAPVDQAQQPQRQASTTPDIQPPAQQRAQRQPARQRRPRPAPTDGAQFIDDEPLP
jgi:hypothetical protein